MRVVAAVVGCADSRLGEYIYIVVIAGKPAPLPRLRFVESSTSER
jgi:hypothetical protein